MGGRPPRAHIPRIITRVIVFLLLGAIVNVAVAWTVPNLLGAKTTITSTYADGSTSVKVRPKHDKRGWPAKALTRWTDPVEGVSYSYTMELGSFELPWWPPLWPGFATNTLFYAGILWLLFAAPFALRRRIGGGRIKRGLCPKCAYPVGASEVCTECGKALPLSLTAVVRERGQG